MNSKIIREIYDENLMRVFRGTVKNNAQICLQVWQNEG